MARFDYLQIIDELFTHDNQAMAGFLPPK